MRARPGVVAAIVPGPDGAVAAVGTGVGPGPAGCGRHRRTSPSDGDNMAKNIDSHCMIGLNDQLLHRHEKVFPVVPAL